MKFKTPILWSICFISISLAQTLNWQIVSSMPIPVKGAKAVVIDSLIYIVGGYSDSLQSNTKYIQEYNPKLNSWRIGGYLIEERSGLVAENYHDSIIVCGGILMNTPITPTLEIWGRNSSATTATIYDVNINFNRVFAASEIFNNHLYLFGGVEGVFPANDSSMLPYIVEYNISEAQISYTSSIHLGVRAPFHQMTARLGNDIFIFGGIYNTISREINKFNISTRTYSEISTNLIRPRAGGAAILNPNGEIFIIGGFNETQPSISATEIFSQDSSGYKVKNGPPLNLPRSECSAVLFDSVIYVFGGISSNGLITPFVEKLNLISAVPDEESSITSKNFILYNNYPNPFNPSTKISWRLNEGSNVTLKIFDILGNEIVTLIDEHQNSGYHEVEFNPSQLGNMSDKKKEWNISSNIYFYQLRVGTSMVAKKMILIK